MFQIIFSHKSINPNKIRDRLLAHRELMQQQSELFVIVGSCYLAVHVGDLEKFDCLYNRKQVLFFFKLDLLLWRESYQGIDVLHYCYYYLLLSD